jgi:hypothetical protein
MHAASLPHTDLLQTEFVSNGEKVCAAIVCIGQLSARLEAWLVLRGGGGSSGTAARSIDDGTFELKRHVADESAEALSGISYLYDVLMGQWDEAGVMEHSFDEPSVCGVSLPPSAQHQHQPRCTFPELFLLRLYLFSAVCCTSLLRSVPGASVVVRC